MTLMCCRIKGKNCTSNCNLVDDKGLLYCSAVLMALQKKTTKINKEITL